MKKTFNIAIAAVFIALVLMANIADPISVGASPQTEDSIASIRQSYARINRRVARYKKIKKELSGFSAEGGELIAYFDGPAIVKVAATYYGETGRTYEEYYYENDKLIFVLHKEFHYNRPLTGKVVRITTTRFYFSDDKLIRWLDETGRPSASDSSEFQEKQKDFLDTSKELIDGARSPKKTIESTR